MAVAPDESAMILSDDEIVRRVLAGDANLYQLLVRRYNSRLYHITWSIVRNEHEAEDVIQDAYVRAYEHLAQFAGRSRFSTWLTRIAVHEAWRRVKRTRKNHELGETSAPLLAPHRAADSPEQSLLTAEARRLLEDAIKALPERLRTVFVMRFLEEMSTAEVADCLEITEEVAKMRLLRARRMLRHALYELARVTGSKAFEFGGERCDHVTTKVVTRITGIR